MQQHVAAGFEPVAEAFEANFGERGEVGAALAVVQDGRTVLDLWGGSAAPGRPWRHDTLQMIFSGTKGLVATALLVLVERGAIELDAPVARYWPEFAARGKQDVTVAEVLSHRGGLPAYPDATTHEDLLDQAGLAARLADSSRQTDAVVYHPLTFGTLVGELIRRVDGRTAGSFFHDEIATPLDLDVWIGLPPEHEHRASEFSYAPGLVQAAPERDFDRRVWANPPLFAEGPIFWNTARAHRAELPAVNALGTARSIARLYGCLALGGTLDGVQLLKPETIDLARSPLARGIDPTTGDDLAYGLGYRLQSSAQPLGPPDDVFGHGGAGGSGHAAWPSARVGVSYVMNELRDSGGIDPRRKAVLTALHEVVSRSSR
ncbi:serine hydrolase domain-containing protein [Saccharopolyspora taberi]|uniref:Serine hydrolase domain-containing protein n=1 Tax=Saccharopolyspora taberi TaxID=60895 RepID=A0ABN3VJP6_9PSEU